MPIKHECQVLENSQTKLMSTVHLTSKRLCTSRPVGDYSTCELPWLMHEEGKGKENNWRGRQLAGELRYQWAIKTGHTNQWYVVTDFVQFEPIWWQHTCMAAFETCRCDSCTEWADWDLRLLWYWRSKVNRIATKVKSEHMDNCPTRTLSLAGWYEDVRYPNSSSPIQQTVMGCWWAVPMS